MKYESKDIAQWLKGAFSVEQHMGAEVKMACPDCGHLNFYFNTHKQIGFCHRATCHSKPTLDDLIDRMGYGPEDAGWVPSTTAVNNREGEQSSRPVFPPGTKLVAEGHVIYRRHARHVYGDYIIQDNVKFNDPYVWEALRTRGVGTTSVIKHKLHYNYKYIYVPIYDTEGNMVQYVGRRIDRRQPATHAWRLGSDIEHERYKYASGTPISQFMWDWTFWREQRNLILVENTFNAIKYRFCTNFGSHLSNKQLDMIQRSMVSNVVLLWDGGTAQKQCDAAAKLRSKGVNAITVEIDQQPDDHQTTDIQYIVDASLHFMMERKAKRAMVHYHLDKEELRVNYMSGK